jgi:hypothetical protein
MKSLMLQEIDVGDCYSGSLVEGEELERQSFLGRVDWTGDSRLRTTTMAVNCG